MAVAATLCGDRGGGAAVGQYIVACIGTCERQTGEAVVFASEGCNVFVRIGAHTGHVHHIGGGDRCHQAHGCEREVGHGAAAVVDLGQTTGCHAQGFGRDLVSANDVDVVAEIRTAHRGLAAGTQAVRTHFELAGSTQKGIVGTQIKLRGGIGAQTSAIFHGDLCSAHAHKIGRLQICDLSSAIASVCHVGRISDVVGGGVAIGGTDVLNPHQQLASGHDGVVTVNETDVVVARR